LELLFQRTHVDAGLFRFDEDAVFWHFLLRDVVFHVLGKHLDLGIVKL